MAFVDSEALAVCRVPCACIVILGDGEDKVAFLAKSVGEGSVDEGRW